MGTTTLKIFKDKKGRQYVQFPYAKRRYRLYTDSTLPDIIKEIREIKKLLAKRRKKKAKKKKIVAVNAPLPVLVGGDNRVELAQAATKAAQKEVEELSFRLRQQLALPPAAPPQPQPPQPAAQPPPPIQPTPTEPVTVDGTTFATPRPVVVQGQKLIIQSFLKSKTNTELLGFLKELNLHVGFSKAKREILTNRLLEQPLDTLLSINEIRDEVQKTTEPVTPKKRKTDGLFANGKLVRLSQQEYARFLQDGVKGKDVERMLGGVKSFTGVFTVDMLAKVRVSSLPFSFVLNHDGHYVAVRIEKGLLEYYDSHGDDMPPTVDRALKKMMKRVADGPYQIKINRVQLQNEKRGTCAYHCIKFLRDRERGVSWQKATKFDQVQMDLSGQGEKDVAKMRKKLGIAEFQHY